MGIVLVVLLAIVAGLLIYRYRSQGTLDILQSDRNRSNQTPEDILKRRLAEGVIDDRRVYPDQANPSLLKLSAGSVRPDEKRSNTMFETLISNLYGIVGTIGRMVRRMVPGLLRRPRIRYDGRVLALRDGLYGDLLDCGYRACRVGVLAPDRRHGMPP